MTLKADGTNGILQQYDYQVPTTGFSYTFAAGTTVLVMNPAGTLATGTITMPAAPVDGMTISFSSTQAITALTVAGNTGQSIVGNPTTMLAGGAATFVYRLSNTTWYAQTNTAQVGSAGSPAPAVTIYTSPATWTKPASLKGVKVTVIGGGGGGASTSGNSQFGGGGVGGVSIASVDAVNIPGPLTITVGAGGTGNPSPTAPLPGTPGKATGNPGGTSSFGTLITATGGAGGPQTSTTCGVGGAGTTSLSPDTQTSPFIAGINYQPQPIQYSGQQSLLFYPANLGVGASLVTQGIVGIGGNILINPAPGATITGTPGTGYGAGGGMTQAALNGRGIGGTGASGLIIVEEFY